MLVIHIILHGGSHSSNGSRAFHDASRHTFRVQDGSPEIMRLEESSATLPAITQAEINSAGDHAITTKEYVDDKVSTAVSNIDVPTFSYNSSNKTLTITT